jgi:esterase/lipase superfamily enzyme
MFFHGFNEHFGDAIVDGRTFASWLNWKSAKWGDNAVIVYGWPASASAYSRASFFAEYPNDETNNVWTRLHLRAFFRAFRKWTPNTRVTLMGHSMGNQLTLDILLSLREDQLQRLSLLPIG